MFHKVALALLMISIIGSLTDFFTLFYICKLMKDQSFLQYIPLNPLLTHSCFVAGLVLALTVPALYERYQDHFDTYGLILYRKLKLLYVRFDQECINKIHKLILETKKLN